MSAARCLLIYFINCLLTPPPPAHTHTFPPPPTLFSFVCGQIIDIPFLRDFAIRAIVPIAYCTKSDIDKVENFVPAYLHRFTRHQWQLLDEEDGIISQHYWDEQDDCISNLFGTYMQHPEEQFVENFGGETVAALEQGTPKKNNPEAFEEGSMRRSPRKNPETLELGTISRRSPRKNPDQGSPICSNTQKLAEEINTVAAAMEATTTVTGAVASITTAATTTEINTVAVATAATTTVVRQASIQELAQRILVRGKI